MPVKYIGRVTEFKGKTLLDILCRLKKFGVGRMVYRNKFHERYPEPSYYVITKVDAYMKGDPTLRTESDDFAQSTAHGMRVFRGKDMGERQMKSLYKTDWRLVPRDQEKDFLSAVSALPREPNKVPDTLPLPPLLRHMILKDLEKEGKGEDSLPKLRPTIQKHYAANALYEGEEQTLDNLGQ